MGAKNFRSLRVLVLDEDANLATAVAAQISALGYSAGHETCPAKSIRQILDEKFDLLVSEYRMRGLDGFQVAWILRTMGSMAPVILHTAVSPDLCPDDLPLLGILGVIPKTLGHEGFGKSFLKLTEMARN